MASRANKQKKEEGGHTSESGERAKGWSGCRLALAGGIVKLIDDLRQGWRSGGMHKWVDTKNEKRAHKVAENNSVIFQAGLQDVTVSH